MRRSVSVAGLAAVLMLGIVGLSVGQKSSVALAQDKASLLEVKIDNFSFGPASLTVAAGTTVTWTNRDDIPHTVVSTDDANFQVQGARHRRKVFLYLQQSGNVSLLLLNSPEDDRQSHRAVSKERPCTRSI